MSTLGYAYGWIMYDVHCTGSMKKKYDVKMPVLHGVTFTTICDAHFSAALFSPLIISQLLCVLFDKVFCVYVAENPISLYCVLYEDN